MKKLNWQLCLGFSLLLLSAILYFCHYLLFHDAHHIFIYLIGDIAFVPVEVLLVTLIIHQILSRREKKNMLAKLNMVIGAFFSEVGLPLLKRILVYDTNVENIQQHLLVKTSWNDKEFQSVAKLIMKFVFVIDAKKSDRMALRIFLIEKREFLLRMLENPNLLEHEKFTEMLWAVFHLTDELAHREDVQHLPDTDIEHLSGDMKRAYKQLLYQWILYLHHLKSEYPYLFSLAVRTNPFNPDVQVIVQ